MTNYPVMALVITNVATGAMLYDTKTKLDALTATKTSNGERDVYGAACVDWLKEEGEKVGERDGEFYLGRSWKKHGQLVFEVIVPKDEEGKKRGDAVCTYDVQSGMLYAYYGPAREEWMFY